MDGHFLAPQSPQNRDIHGFRGSHRVLFSQLRQVRRRARRSEFWYFRLFTFLASAGLLLVIGAVGAAAGRPHEPNPIALGLSFALIVFWLAIFIPDLAVTVRRLHDTDRSGLVVSAAHRAVRMGRAAHMDVHERNRR